MINDGESSSFEFLDFLTIIGFGLQLINYMENQQQSNNDDIMSELQKQDKAYLEKILENQNKILKLLEESNSPNG
jgi:hypothetical protein